MSAVMIRPQQAQELAPQQSTQLLLVPQSLDQLDRIAQLIASSDLAPKDYKGKPGNVAVAIAMGLELGVSPMQAIQGIAVINGRPSVWGDLMLALCRAHPQCDSISERLEYDPAGNVTAARCKAVRNGHEQERAFTIEDAKRARLWGKEGPWSLYPNRMLQMRARAFCLRDVFADALKGLSSADEQSDVDAPTPTPRPTPVRTLLERSTYPDADFAANLPKWRAAIESGKKTPDEIIAMVSTKGALTDEQKSAIKTGVSAEVVQ